MMNAEADLIRYYAQRAQQYERVYHKPERQSDLRKLRELVASVFSGKRVLEIACGTGYWTELIAPHATSVMALDINEEVLAFARTKPGVSGKVTFQRWDAFDLQGLPGGFNAGLAGFWWSHVAKRRLREFLRGLHSALAPGATVIFFDNAFVSGSSTPLSRKDSDGNPLSHRDEEGNTYQERILDDGSTHQIIKNFPTAEEIRETLNGMATELEIVFLTYYWIVTYRV